MGSISCFTTSDDFDRLRLPWHALWQETRDASLFQSYAWFQALRRRVPGKSIVLAVRDGRRISGLLPLRVSRITTLLGGAVVLSFPLPTWGPVFGPIGPEPTVTWLAVLEYLRSRCHDWDVCDWRGVDVAHVDFGRLETAGEFRGFRFVKSLQHPWRAVQLDTAAASSSPIEGSEAVNRERKNWERSGTLTVTRQFSRRLRIVNSVGDHDSHDLAMSPLSVSMSSATGLFAERESGWLSALSCAGGATGDLICYECSAGGELLGRWHVACAEEHWALLGRWSSAKSDPSAVETTLLRNVLQDATRAGMKRVWLDIEQIEDEPVEDASRRPVRFRAVRRMSWRGACYRWSREAG